MAAHKHSESEEWRSVGGFEGCYEVSNMGRVRSLPRSTVNWAEDGAEPRILIPAATNYPSVSLWKGGALKVRKVHRLVAEAFIPNPEKKREVNHIDADRLNNKVGNLEWVTPAENRAHAQRLGLLPRGANHKNTKVDPDVVRNLYDRGLTQRAVAVMVGISQSRLSTILSSKGTSK